MGGGYSSGVGSTVPIQQISASREATILHPVRKPIRAELVKQLVVDMGGSTFFCTSHFICLCHLCGMWKDCFKGVSSNEHESEIYKCMNMKISTNRRI